MDPPSYIFIGTIQTAENRLLFLAAASNSLEKYSKFETFFFLFLFFH